MSDVIISGINFGQLVKVKFNGQFAYVDSFYISKLSSVIDIEIVGDYDHTKPAYVKHVISVDSDDFLAGVWINVYSIDYPRLVKLVDNVRESIGPKFTVAIEDREHWF